MSGYPKISVLDLDSKRQWNEVNKDWYIQEKVDGSQLSVSINKDGSLTFWNKNKAISDQAKVFAKACSMIKAIQDKLNPEYRYHGEAVCCRRHGIVHYATVPPYYWILYDIQVEATRKYLSVDEMEAEAKRIGLAFVQRLYQNSDAAIQPIPIVQDLIDKIERGELTSTLGGNSIEGVVLKHHNFVSDKGITATKQKFVSSQFKERHASGVGKSDRNMNPDEFLDMLGSQFNTAPRFTKAIQHLKEADKFQPKPNEMFKISQELDSDLEAECKALIQEFLWVEFSPKIFAASRKNLKEWYENFLKEEAVREEERRNEEKEEKVNETPSETL